MDKAELTDLVAASSILSAGIIETFESLRICFASIAFVPSNLTTTGTSKLSSFTV